MVSKEHKPESSELQQLRDLYDLMVSEGLDAIEIKQDDVRIKLNRRHSGFVVQAVAPNAAGISETLTSEIPSTSTPVSDISENQQSIQAPLAGVFYRASSPTSSPFAKEGDVVDVGQTLCIVEAMKVMNEIKAESRCRIARIVAENSRPVTAGQALFLVEPA